MNTTTAAVAPTWSEIEGRRVLREYQSRQGMLDDIWEAHEHGWLPVSMTESRQDGERKFPPWGAAAGLSISSLTTATPNHRPRYNIAPADPHWIVRMRFEDRELLPAKWG